MRRSLAIAALALAAATTPATAAWQVPPPPAECDIFQNCLCGIAGSVVYRVTGRQVLHCA